MPWLDFITSCLMPGERLEGMVNTKALLALEVIEAATPSISNDPTRSKRRPMTVMLSPSKAILVEIPEGAGPR